MVLTLEIVLRVRLLGLVVVDHLHDLKQIVLLQLRQRVGQLLHVDASALGLALWLGRGCGTVRLADWSGFLEDREEFCLWVAEALLHHH